MGLFRSSNPDVQALRDADTNLHAHSRAEKAAGIRDETPEFRELNATANDAAAKVSRWRGGTK